MTKSKKGIIYECVQYLKSTQEDVLFSNTFRNNMATRCGTSSEVIRGSIMSCSGGKLMGEPYFKENWIMIQKPSRLVRKSYANTHNIKAYSLSYDTPAKHKTREMILSPILKSTKKISTMLTMASSEGLDVKLVLDKKPNTKIVNIEYKSEVLQEYKKNGFNTEDYLCKSTEFLKRDTRKFDLINYDSMSYLCEYIAEDLKIINDDKRTNYLAITMLNIEGIRNHGQFAEHMRTAYADDKTPTSTFLREVLSNYEKVNEEVYKRESGARSMKMTMWKLKAA